jgi:hypothetical protein
MTLTGRAAQQHPDVDALKPVTIAVATHAVAPDGHGDQQRQSTGAERADVIGTVDPETGTYRSVSNAVSEKDRRSLGLRRNGRPRKHPAARSSQ